MLSYYNRQLRRQTQDFEHLEKILEFVKISEGMKIEIYMIEEVTV